MSSLDNDAQYIEARLRYEAAEPNPLTALCREAAQIIRQLREENKRLREENK